MKPEIILAILKSLKAPEIEPGTYSINEVITLRISGGIKVGSPTLARIPSGGIDPWKALASICSAWHNSDPQSSKAEISKALADAMIDPWGDDPWGAIIADIRERVLAEIPLEVRERKGAVRAACKIERIDS